MKVGSIKNQFKKQSARYGRENMIEGVSFFVSVMKAEFTDSIDPIFPNNASWYTFFAFPVVN